jgi:hypothetical protein
MGHSERLALRDIRSVYRILGEITDVGLTPHLWRRHMLVELSRLVGARVGITVDLQNALPGRVPSVIDSVDVGFVSERESGLWLEYLRSTDMRQKDPPLEAMMRLHQTTRFFTRDRQQLVDCKTWYASPLVSEGRRYAGIDHFVVTSAQVARPGWLTGFVLYRPWGDRPFHPRCRKIIQLFHLELLRRLWPTGRNTPREYLELPRHQRMILRGILAGNSAREMADSLQLSTHTVNSYTKNLYSRLGIDSRGQMFTHFLNKAGGRPVFLPQEFEA